MIIKKKTNSYPLLFCRSYDKNDRHQPALRTNNNNCERSLLISSCFTLHSLRRFTLLLAFILLIQSPIYIYKIRQVNNNPISLPIITKIITTSHLIDGDDDDTISNSNDHQVTDVSSFDSKILAKIKKKNLRTKHSESDDQSKDVPDISQDYKESQSMDENNQKHHKSHRNYNSPNQEEENVRSSEQRDDNESQSEEEDNYFVDKNAPIADWEYYPKLPRRVKEPDLDEDDFDFLECPRFMNTIDTSPPIYHKPTHEACEGYDGVLQIHHYDRGAASGTAFFEFTIGMLQWADQHNYLPWIHIEDGYTKPIWDEHVHTKQRRKQNRSFTMKTGIEIQWARDKRDKQYKVFAGKPVVQNQQEGLTSKTFYVKGTGVWEHYFMPVSDFVPGDKSCQGKPLVKFDDEHIVPGIHSYSPWAPRAWRHTDSQLILVSEEISWDDWFRPQRKHAAEIVDRYIRFNPMMIHRAKCSLPNPEFSLGMHIRHGDKYLERDVIQVSRFYLYAKEFVENGGGSIYVASDSAKVYERIEIQWPKYVSSHVVRQPAVVGLTTNETAAFDIGVSPHRTNVEALTDLLVLSKCTFFLHGLSALSEAVLYINPGLVNRSINLEDDGQRYKDVEYFVEKMMPLGRRQQNAEVVA